MKATLHASSLRRRLARVPLMVWVSAGTACLIGLLLLISSLHMYGTARQWRNAFLASRADSVVDYVAGQLRGPQRRALEDLPQILQETSLRFAGHLASLGISDDQQHYSWHSDATRIGKPLLHAAQVPQHPQHASGEWKYSSYTPDGRSFVLTARLRLPGGRPWSAVGPQLRLVEVGVIASDADFVIEQAGWLAMLAGLALFILTLSSGFLLATVGRNLELVAQRDQQQRLADLGRLSAAMAHEIRNPLGAIKGLSQLILERQGPAAAERGYAQTVVDECVRLEELVHSLLDFARLPEPQTEALDLAALVRALIADLQPEFAAAQVQLQLQAAAGLPRIPADRKLIRQVLLNVLHNAREASPAQGVVRLHLFCPPDRPDVLRLECLDQGQGISEEARRSLFEPFFTTKAQGTGLGLLISQRIMEKHGGTISLGNHADGGALCTLDFPRRQGSARAAARGSEKS